MENSPAIYKHIIHENFLLKRFQWKYRSHEPERSTPTFCNAFAWMLPFARLGLCIFYLDYAFAFFFDLCHPVLENTNVKYELHHPFLIFDAHANADVRSEQGFINTECLGQWCHSDIRAYEWYFLQRTNREIKASQCNGIVTLHGNGNGNGTGTGNRINRF